jgi:hypothetical protein
MKRLLMLLSLFATYSIAESWNCYTVKAMGSSPIPLAPCTLSATGYTTSQTEAFQVQLQNLQLNSNQGAPVSANAVGQGVCVSAFSPVPNQLPQFLADTWQYVGTTQIQWSDSVQNYAPYWFTVPGAGSVVYGWRTDTVSTGGSTTYFNVSPCTCYTNDCCNVAAQGKCPQTCPPHSCTNCGPAAIAHPATSANSTPVKPVPPAALCTPIVLDLSGKGYHFSHPSEGVWFDVFGTGESLKIEWPTQESGNAWLVLPDERGQVTQFSQFFGNLSPQPPTANPNGFLALAVWDRIDKGGNMNGYIDPGDDVWPLLRLWVDANHDGVAQPRELHSLNEAGIHWISLDYKDGRPGLFRLAGTADLPTRGPSRIWDVWLSSQQ